MSSRLRRMLTAGAAIVVFIVLAGATYQGVATALERREYPRPGGLVSVGDHQLHIYCTGDGSPTVILEAPAAGLSAAWGDVQQRIATPEDLDSAVVLGLGYPHGPLAMGDALGAQKVLGVLGAMHECYREPRYRPSPWLRRRAQLGVSLLTEES